MTQKLIIRAGATNKTRAKYKAQDFEWGKKDCIHMARSHLIRFGHRPPRLPKYNSALTAVRALKRAGYNDLIELFDSFLPRIAPASALIGDIILMDDGGAGPLDAITISVGENVMGWHEDYDEAVVIIPHEVKAAWSVLI